MLGDRAGRGRVGDINERGRAGGPSGRIVHRRRRLPRRPDVLPEPFPPPFAPEPALAVPTEAGCRVELVGAVDPDGAGLDLCGNVQGEVDVLAPDAGREAVARVVRERDRLLRGPEGHEGDDGPEDLLLRDRRGGRHIGEECGWVEPPVLRAAPGRLPHHGALLHALADHALDPFELDRRDNGADVDRLVERVTDAELLHARLEPLDEPLGHALLHQDPRARAADLALVEPDRVDHTLDHTVEIRVLENDEGRLPAELEGEPLARPGGPFPDDAADLGRAGEGDLVDVRVCHERCAGATVAGHDVDDAGRQAHLVAHLRKEERRERRVLGRLEHDRVPHGERGRDLPREHEEREVPRDDLPGHADRLVSPKLRFHELRPPSMVIEMPRDEGDVDVARLTDRLAVVERFEDGEEPCVLLHVTGEGVEVAGAGVAADVAPRRERFTRGADGAVDVALAPLRHARDRRAGRRVVGLEVLALSGRLPLAGDEMPEFPAVAVEPLLGRRRRLGCGAVFHRFEDLRDLHAASVRPWGAGTPQSTGR